MTTMRAGCYYKNGQVHCSNEKKKEIDDEIAEYKKNGWIHQGCFCVDSDCSMARCDGSECGKFAVFVKASGLQVIIIPDAGFCD